MSLLFAQGRCMKAVVLRPISQIKHSMHSLHGNRRFLPLINDFPNSHQFRKSLIRFQWGSVKHFSSTKETDKPKLVPVDEARRFIKECFKAVKVPEENANIMADVLICADYRGIFTHGMNRLEMYLNDLSNNVTDGAAVPKIIRETAGTAWINGCNGIGSVVGYFCMNLAIKKAKEIGVGWVVAKNSNHYGIGGWYSLIAMKHCLIGITMSNTSPLMVPTRAKTAALGTNPIAFGAIGKNTEYVLDISTTAVSLGKIELARRKGENIPATWAQDPDGKPTTDAEIAFKAASLLPLGGTEMNSGYKGYGLGGMVDILCGVMSGANYSTKVRKWVSEETKTAADLGHIFIAVDPNAFAPDFDERLCDFNNRLKSSKPTNPCEPVLIPGEYENLHMKSVDEAGGLQYIENQLKTCEALSKRFKVKPLTFNK